MISIFLFNRFVNFLLLLLLLLLLTYNFSSAFFLLNGNIFCRSKVIYYLNGTFRLKAIAKNILPYIESLNPITRKGPLQTSAIQVLQDISSYIRNNIPYLN
jgi:hypothetical protein